MSEQITVLKDEALGGVEREYREVKRKAAVGERIKISKDCGKFYSEGDIATVKKVSTEGVCGDFSGNKRVHDDGMWYVGESDIGYVVLEATDIIRIDGERFRMVERKAAEGERVLITYSRRSCFSIGDVRLVRRVAEYDGRREVYSVDGPGVFCLRREDSLVLEPLTSASKLSANVTVNIPPEFSKTLAGLVDTVAKLSVKVAELERNMPKHRPATSEEFTKAMASITAAFANLGPSKLTRDNVIERAKVDVAELLRTSRSVPFDYINFWPQLDGEKTDWIPLQYVEFVVNREKRTVAALIKYLPKYIERKLYAKGIAKCAPGDVFSEDIGKAIALRRALGLEVPREYAEIDSRG